MIDDILTKAQNDFDLEPDDVAELLATPLFSMDAARMQAASRLKSRKASLNYAEVHAVLGRINTSDESPESYASMARQLEQDGVNALIVGYEGSESSDDFLKRSSLIRNALSPKTMIVAAVNAVEEKPLDALKSTGYNGVHLTVHSGNYDDLIALADRCETIRAAGLLPGICLVGLTADITDEALVSALIAIRDAEPALSAVARHDPLGAGRYHEPGRLTTARLTHIMTVMRLTMFGDVPAVGIHEPDVMGAVAGANILWATAAGNQPGPTVITLREMFYDAQWRVLDGPSLCYGGTSPEQLLKNK
ncbi:MAG: hypothetical protein JW763_02505 [candidate division Zixibacteria bacterium]|nr:hypothetical protein [candidate division Zixibacteria bacterium]